MKRLVRRLRCGVRNRRFGMHRQGFWRGRDVLRLYPFRGGLHHRHLVFHRMMLGRLMLRRPMLF